MIDRYLNACNEIYNHNMMHQSDLGLEKYWATQSGYFRLATIVALVRGIKDGNLLTGSSPRCPLRSHSLVNIKNNSYFVGIGPICDVELS